MDLERDERLIEARGLLSPFVFVALLAATIVVVRLGLNLTSVVVALLALIATALAIVWTSRHVTITDRRIAEYRVLLARLARRFPRLAPLEARRRVSIALPDVLSVRRSGTTILLALRDGRKHEMHCHDESEAARLLTTIDQQLKRAPWLRPKRALIAPKVSVTSTSDVGTRCPYCHDDVPDDEAAECERCGAVQHEECIEIHGGCAAFSCGGTAKRRERA
jgi:hypothetical protein